MLSRSKKQPAKKPATRRPGPQKSAVHVVFSITVNKETGAQGARQIIGIFQEREDAEKLENAFNEQEQKSEEVIIKAFTMRYTLPFVAPIAKDLMEQ